MAAAIAPADFWRPFESTASSFDEVLEFVELIREKWIATQDRDFAWRGVVNAEWPLDSSLHRRVAWTFPNKPPKEKTIYKFEGDMLADVHRWGLHWNTGARLPVLHQLAMLQHYGAPTRLLDISFNAWIGVFFAVEEKWSNGSLVHENSDGRLFAIDVTNHIINEKDTLRDWADSMTRPWSPERTEQKKWCTSVYAWRPPQFDRRMAAQNGGFLFGGVPVTQTEKGTRKFWPKTTSPGSHWHIADVRRCTSVALRPHLLGDSDISPGAAPNNPLYTLRIRAAAKPEIRLRLKRLFGYEHATIYPDFPGFASFGVSKLKSSP